MDTGDFQKYPGAREFFNQPIPKWCCQQSDGHPTEVRRTDEGYEAFIAGTWWPVPNSAIKHGITSPFGIPVVWYVLTCGSQRDIPCIRCVILNPGELAAVDEKAAAGYLRFASHRAAASVQGPPVPPAP